MAAIFNREIFIYIRAKQLQPIRRKPGQEAVKGEDHQAGVFQGHQDGEDISAAGRAFRAGFARILQRGIVTVVTVGNKDLPRRDQLCQLRPVLLPVHRPEGVFLAAPVGEFKEGRFLLQMGADFGEALLRIGEKTEDRTEVGPAAAQQLQAVLFR